MIQRIQSIYLVLAGLFPAFTFFLPLLQSRDKDLTLVVQGFNCGASYHVYGLLPIYVLSVFLTIAAIFCYNNRKKQIKAVNFAITSNLMWYVVLFGHAVRISQETGCSWNIQWGIFLPAVAILFLYMAKRAIRHDEALVRAADRIR